MGVQKFEDLIAWQKAQELAVLIYSLFDSNRDFAFRDQIRRAAVSISNNIAEGFDRSSNADFIRFLYFSIGSASELKSMLYLSKRLSYINSSEFDQSIEKTNEVSKIIRGLINSLKPKP
ncbi:four helix bundle protein [Ekhidna sp.]|uniref:four helix bundle protein n=1 Tax=Ekhidna sp. TaxID=2608089 RepID=UPI003510E599